MPSEIGSPGSRATASTRRLWNRLGRWRWPLVAFTLLVLFWIALHGLLPAGEVRCELEQAGGLDAGSTDLIVLLHALDRDSTSLEPARRVATDRTVLGDADVLACDLPFALLSMARSEEVVAGLVAEIDQAWSRKPYRRIYLVGHSMGGLFARKAYVVAAGETAEAPFEPELKALLRPGAPAPEELVPERPWASKVERIVLLAGMNRGWSIDHHMSIGRALAMTAGVWLGDLLELRFGRRPLIFSIRRGASFITELRLQWLEMRRRAREDPGAAGRATTVQLLGSMDDLVSPDDNIDLLTEGDFVFLDVPHSGHANVIEMRLPEPEAADRSPEGERGRVFAQAIVGAAAGEGTSFGPSEDREVTDVVFVIHGIRDEGFWTRKIAGRVRSWAAQTDPARKIAIETSTYGYFPMLPFLRSGARRDKVEWLMDRYTEARARYPIARFHYVGHSNGTYLLTKALELYPSVRFDRVVFAGSVVRTDYPWSEAIRKKQAGAVLNFVATGDWVVGFFPKALEIAGWQDLGSAGHDGFASPSVAQVEYAKGSHGAALGEDYWDSIAQFILDAELNERFAADLSVRDELVDDLATEQSTWVRSLSRIAPVLWILIVGALAGILYWLIKRPGREWVKTVIVIAYLQLIWMVLTRL